MATERYSIIHATLPGDAVLAAVQAVRGENIRHAARSGMVFADLSPAQASELERQGFRVRRVQAVHPGILLPPPPIVVGPEVTSALMFQEARWDELFMALDPPLTGKGIGITIAVLDTGIRATHQDLAGKVVHEANFTNSPTAEDKFDHGTGVAWMAVGGREAPEGGSDTFRGYAMPQGFAPGAWLMNIKVLNDDGEGDEETVVAGIEEVIRLWEEHPLVYTPQGTIADPLHPDIVNLSLGTPDDGDPLHPIRVAVRALMARNIGVVASAGNTGPGPGTISNPATEPYVMAVGAVDLNLQVADFSSRGPTLEGEIKPDIALFGVNLVTASAQGDDAYRNVSGTSFSAGAASGGTAVLAEALVRTIGPSLLEGGTEALVVGIRQLTPSITTKPQGNPVGKDDAYGWGIPFGNLVVDQLKRMMAPAMAQDIISGLAVPLFSLALVGMMTTSVLRGARQK